MIKLWLVLILLSAVSYVIVQRSVSSITKTPVWLCWLVMMFPALLWTVWSQIYGESEPIPVLLLLIPLLVCPLIYGWLVQIGKPIETKSKSQPANNADSHQDTVKLIAKSLKPINSEEETSLRSCFPWNIYYLQNIDYRPQAILCRGKLKAIPEEAYHRVKTNVEKEFGDRFFLILQEGLKGQPFFALVPNPQAQGSKKDLNEPVTQNILAFLFLAMTLFTTTVAGIEIAGFTLEQLNSEPDILTRGLLYSVPLIAILTVHELGHFFTSNIYKLRCTLPYLIPFPLFLGTLGAFVQRRSPSPHRRALFDIAIAGPVAGFLITLPILFWGLTQSQTVPLETSNLFDFKVFDPRVSFFLAMIAKFALGGKLGSDLAINLHPIAIAGYVGLMFTAFNLIPVGQLDGGNIAHAVFGQRTALIIGQVARILTTVLAWINPSFWFLAIFLWLMPLIDQPALNDITELDSYRDLAGLLSLGLLIFILLPLPGTVANWLNF